MGTVDPFFLSDYNFTFGGEKDPSLLSYVYFGIDYGDELVPTQYSAAPYAAFQSNQPAYQDVNCAPSSLEKIRMESASAASNDISREKRKASQIVATGAVRQTEKDTTEAAVADTPKKPVAPRPCAVCKVRFPFAPLDYVLTLCSECSRRL